MRWILFLLYPVFLIASPPKVMIFDYGGVMAKAHYEPLFRFLSQSLDIPYKKIKNDFSHYQLKEALQQPLSYWEAYSGKTLSMDWLEKFEKKQEKMIQRTPGMQELVAEIKLLGIQTALLSNTGKSRAAFLHSMGEYDLFEPVLVSCNLGTKKPKPQVYVISLNHLRIEAKECLFVDDKKRNVDAAKKLGMDGIVFHSREQLIKELKKRGIALK